MTLEKGCTCDLCPGEEMDECCLDTGRFGYCKHASFLHEKKLTKESCAYWKPNTVSFKVNSVIGEPVFVIPKELLGPIYKILEVFEYGQNLHGERWKSQPVREQVLHAVQHIENYSDGDVCEKESGLPNLAHAVCRLLFAMHLDEK